MRTKILITAAAGVLAAGAFAVGADADATTTGDIRQARADMHEQMGGPMGAGMMSGDVMASMHEAIDPAAMDAMHAQMRDLLPPELRDEADAMHEAMPDQTEAGGVDHDAHHRSGS